MIPRYIQVLASIMVFSFKIALSMASRALSYCPFLLNMYALVLSLVWLMSVEATMINTSIITTFFILFFFVVIEMVIH